MELARLYDVFDDEATRGAASDGATKGGGAGSGSGAEAKATSGDGEPAMFLVDRLWPRGVRKERLPLTGWLKNLAPSNGLRKAYHAGDIDYEELGRRYRAELDESNAAGELDEDLAALREAGAKPPRSDAKTPETPKDNVLLLYGAKDRERNHARVLLEWLDQQLRG